MTTRDGGAQRERQASDGSRGPVFPEIGTPMGADALRAYALVYCSLALTADEGLRESAGRVMRTVLTGLSFPRGAPSIARVHNGYCEQEDCLWLRPYKVLFGGRTPRALASGVKDQHLTFYKKRPLEKGLMAFLISPALERWPDNPVSVRSLPDLDQKALTSILGDRTPDTVPFCGYLLVGYDKDKSPGVVRLGVRRSRWLASTNLFEERFLWLQFPPDIVTPMLPNVGGQDLSMCLPGPPVVQRFVGEPLALRYVARALLSWHETQGPDPWQWRRHRFADRTETHVEVIRLGSKKVAACFLPYVSGGAEAVSHISRALANWPRERDPVDRGALILASALPLEVLEQAIGTVMGSEPGLVDGLRFLIVDGWTIESLAKRYPWVWDLELEVIHEGAYMSYAVPFSCVRRLDRLSASGERAAALAAARSLIVFPWAATEEQAIVGLVLNLINNGCDQPWGTAGDIARALRPELRRAWKDEQHRFLISERWWATAIAHHILEAVPPAAWVPAPSVGSREWHGFVRLLRCWRSVTAENAATDLANGVHERLVEHGAATDTLDAAWRESLPPHLTAGLGVKEPAIWSALRKQ
jgi:hypothetical protein